MPYLLLTLARVLNVLGLRQIAGSQPQAADTGSAPADPQSAAARPETRRTPLTQRCAAPELCDRGLAAPSDAGRRPEDHARHGALCARRLLVSANALYAVFPPIRGLYAVKCVYFRPMKSGKSPSTPTPFQYTTRQYKRHVKSGRQVAHRMSSARLTRAGRHARRRPRSGDRPVAVPAAGPLWTPPRSGHCVSRPRCPASPPRTARRIAQRTATGGRPRTGPSPVNAIVDPQRTDPSLANVTIDRPRTGVMLVTITVDRRPTDPSHVSGIAVRLPRTQVRQRTVTVGRRRTGVNLANVTVDRRLMIQVRQRTVIGDRPPIEASLANDMRRTWAAAAAVGRALAGSGRR